MVTNVSVKFNYDRLRIDKALGNCLKSDSNKKNKKNNVRSAVGPVSWSKYDRVLVYGVACVYLRIPATLDNACRPTF